MQWNLRQKVPQRCAAGCSIRGSWAGWTPSTGIQPLLQPGVPSYFLLSKGEPWQAEVLARLWEAWHAVDEEPDDYENRVRYLLSAALHTLAAHCPVGECRSSRQEQVAAQRMKQMLRFVEEHYAEELTVERIADSVALSESACLRSFRQLLGTTPIQYVKQYRIEKAAGLLLTTRLRTGEIGAECGFTDLSYFTKTFREIKHCGVPNKEELKNAPGIPAAVCGAGLRQTKSGCIP